MSTYDRAPFTSKVPSRLGLKRVGDYERVATTSYLSRSPPARSILLLSALSLRRHLDDFERCSTMFTSMLTRDRRHDRAVNQTAKALNDAEVKLLFHYLYAILLNVLIL